VVGGVISQSSLLPIKQGGILAAPLIERSETVSRVSDEGHKSYRNKNSNIFGGKGEMTQNKNEEMELIDRDATLPNPRK